MTTVPTAEEIDSVFSSVSAKSIEKIRVAVYNAMFILRRKEV